MPKPFNCSFYNVLNVWSMDQWIDWREIFIWSRLCIKIIVHVVAKYWKSYHILRSCDFFYQKQQNKEGLKNE